jgi:hypothetical protein
LLRWPNTGPPDSILNPISTGISTPIHCGGFGATACLAIGRIDGVAAPVAVAALRDICDDQFVIDTAPERPALRLPFFDSALAGHHTRAGRAWTIGGW